MSLYYYLLSSMEAKEDSTGPYIKLEVLKNYVKVNMYFGDLQWIFAWQRDQASLPPLIEFDPVSFLPLGGQWPESGLLRRVWHMVQHSLYRTEHRVRLQRGKGEMNCWSERQPWFFYETTVRVGWFHDEIIVRRSKTVDWLSVCLAFF